MTSDVQTIARRYLRRNFTLGVLNGALYETGDALISSSLVLPLFVAHLGGGPLLIGLLQPISLGGWFLPQFFVSRYIQHLPRKKDAYVAAAAIRIASLGLLVLTVFLLGPRAPGLLLFLFFVLMAVFRLAAGLAGLSFMDIVGKAIPPQRRGLFMGGRNFLGGLGALGSGALVSLALGRRWKIPFPYNYGLLFAVAWVTISLALFAFSQVVEPEEPQHPPETPFREQLRRALRLIEKPSNYRRYLISRLCLVAVGMATPFYIVFAREALGVPPAMTGLYLALMSGVAIASNLVWARISDVRGNKLLFQLATALGLLAPLLALTVPLLQPRVAPHTLALTFGAVFVGVGASQSAVRIGGVNLVLDLAPAGERPLYVGFTNTVVGMVLLLSSVGGVIVHVVGYRALFGLALGMGAVALWIARRLEEPRALPPDVDAAPVDMLGPS